MRINKKINVTNQTYEHIYTTFSNEWQDINVDSFIEGVNIMLFEQVVIHILIL